MVFWGAQYGETLRSRVPRGSLHVTPAGWLDSSKALLTDISFAIFIPPSLACFSHHSIHHGANVITPQEAD